MSKVTLTIANHPAKFRYCEPAEIAAAIKERLKTGVAHFVFKKVSDGSIREAYGTTSPEFLNRFYASTEPAAQAKAAKPENPNNTGYFDMEAMAWRNFVNENAVMLY